MEQKFKKFTEILKNEMSKPCEPNGNHTCTLKPAKGQSLLANDGMKFLFVSFIFCVFAHYD